MTMRVVPSLTVAVTEDGFRKRKRILMLVSGLPAYPLYKFLQAMGWHDEIGALLLACGLFSAVTAIISYAYGRERRVLDVIREGDVRTLAWIGLWIGGLYGVQLSLMVLALLKVVTYSYLEHPDGPAMMVLMIAPTSVARDAFEIGHLRLLQQQGRPFVTFPDGKALWALVTGRSDLWAAPVAMATLAVTLAYGGLAMAASFVLTDLGHLAAIGLLVGLVCTVAFVQGFQPAMTIWDGWRRYAWRELFRFFIWPGVAFGWTYYLVLLGAINFLLAVPDPSVWTRMLLTTGVAGLMSFYGYYLGRCRWQEEQLHATIPPSLLRCPFILGMLTSKKA